MSTFAKSAHLLVYSTAFGASLYQSFYAGILAYRNLSIQDFSALQNALFPGYFALQVASSAVLLFTKPARFGNRTLAIALVTSAVNAFVVLPLSQRVSKRRAEQAALEGKSWRDADISDELKGLNKEFAKYHSVSVLANFGTIGSLLAYGVFLAGAIAF